MVTKFSLSTVSTCWVLCRGSTGGYLLFPFVSPVPFCALWHRGWQRLHIPSTVPCSQLMGRQGGKEGGCLHGREPLTAALSELSVKCSSCCCLALIPSAFLRRAASKVILFLLFLPVTPPVPHPCTFLGSVVYLPHCLVTHRALWGPSMGVPSVEELLAAQGICDL